MPSFISTSATQCAGLRSRWRGIWGLVVLHVLSQSPMPVFHFHGDPDSDSLHSSTIASHLRTCHDPKCGHHAEPLGWHCHFLLPGMMTEVPLGEDDPGQNDQTVPLLIAKVSTETIHATALNPICLLPDLLRSASECGPNQYSNASLASRHFLDGFADELSLPERLSIARC